MRKARKKLFRQRMLLLVAALFFPITLVSAKEDFIVITGLKVCTAAGGGRKNVSSDEILVMSDNDPTPRKEIALQDVKPWTIKDYEKWNHENYRSNPAFYQPVDWYNIDFGILNACVFFMTDEMRVKKSAACLGARAGNIRLESFSLNGQTELFRAL